MRDGKQSQNHNQTNELAALVSNQSIPRAEMALYIFSAEGTFVLWVASSYASVLLSFAGLQSPLNLFVQGLLHSSVGFLVGFCVSRWRRDGWQGGENMFACSDLRLPFCAESDNTTIPQLSRTIVIVWQFKLAKKVIEKRNFNIIKCEGHIIFYFFQRAKSFGSV